MRRRLELSADEETYRSWLKDGIPFTTRVPVTDAVKFVKVVAYDYAADLLGMVFLKIGK